MPEIGQLGNETSDDSEPPPTPAEIHHYTPSEIERLGRERPAQLPSMWAELGFCFSLLMSMFIAEYFVSGFNILLPALADALDIPSEAQVWPASVFSLVTGAFLLPIGRLADIYGGYVVFVSGLVWFVVWSLVAGFSTNYLMLIVCRALQGFGPAAFLPSGIMLLGSTYRPGPRKNVVFSLYGAFAPIGFFAGIFFAGLAAQIMTWRWYFFIGTIALAVVALVSVFCVPKDGGDQNKGEKNSKEKIKMDWYGTATVIPALILIVFALTQGAHAPDGWKTPYIPVLFVVGCLFLGAYIWIEGWVAEQPLLPFDMFEVKGMKPMTIALFLDYGVFGIFLFYASFYIEEILHASPLLTAAWFAPMCIGGLILSTVGGLILHLLPGTVLLVISGICFVLSVLLFAILPTDPSYWAYVFPAMICATAGVDVTYNVTNIFITTSLPKSRQGLAGALINSILFLGISFFLGLADLAVTEEQKRGKSTRDAYKVAFWFAVAAGGAACLVMGARVRIGKAASGLTVEEQEELERELTRRSSAI